MSHSDVWIVSASFRFRQVMWLQRQSWSCFYGRHYVQSCMLVEHLLHAKLYRNGHIPCLLSISYVQSCTEMVTPPRQSQPMEETLMSLGSFGFVNTARLSHQMGTGSCPDQSYRVRQEHTLHPVSPKDAHSARLYVFCSLGVPSSRKPSCPRSQ